MTTENNLMNSVDQCIENSENGEQIPSNLSELVDKLKSGDINEISRFLDDFVFSPKSETLLLIASRVCGNVNVFKHIHSISQNEINLRDGNGNTALHLFLTNFYEKKIVTSREQFDQIVTMFLENGSDLKIKNTHGIIPIHIACKFVDEVTIVKLVNYCPSSVRICDENGNTVFHHCANANTEKNVSGKCLSLFVKLGGDIDMQNNDNYSPIELAQKNENESFVQTLANMGADVRSLYLNMKSQLQQLKKKQKESVLQKQTLRTSNAKSDKESKSSSSSSDDDSEEEKKRKKQLKNEKKRREKILANEKVFLTFLKNARKYDHKTLEKEVEKLLPRLAEVPITVRADLWKCFARIDEVMAEKRNLYTTNITADFDAKVTEQIDLDIKRTFADRPEFTHNYGTYQSVLFKALCVYSAVDSGVGYCQGMSEIGALICLIIKDENPETTFWFIFQLLQYPKFGLRGFFEDALPLSKVAAVTLDALIKIEMPKLSKHFTSISMSSNLYVPRWMMVCFVGVLPFECVLSIWDIMFAIGAPRTLFRVALAILKWFESELLHESFEEVAVRLTHLEFDEEDIPKFLKLVLKTKPKAIFDGFEIVKKK